MLESAFFWLFGGLAVAASLGVILSRNTMHSVMWLILCFFNAAGLFFLLDAEFLGIILILIYVVMMLEVNEAVKREGWLQYLPVGGMIAVILFIELVAASTSGLFGSEQMAMAAHMGADVNNTVEIGKELYTRYLLGFEIAAIILLVALIGAIVLTLRERKDAKYQNISKQVHVRKEDRLRKVSM